MVSTLKLPVGIDSFEKIRRNGFYYIDKTNLIEQILMNWGEVTLFTRPRRFGKTLNMSMLNCFFSRQYAEKGTIFEGLSIWKQEKYRRLQGTYPVIFLSFADVKQNNYQDAVQKIKNIIVDAYRQHRYLEQEECFTQNEKQQMLEITEKMSDVTAQDALNNLSSYLNLLYGKKVLIFLDEYDTPMQEAYIHGYWGEFAGFMRSIFNATFKTNQYLERAVMTGITSISKESVFSVLNILTFIRTTSDAFADCFGFTEQEVKELLAYCKAEFSDELKKMYDGYHFGSTDVYNPWSISCYAARRRMDSYWVNTSENSILRNALEVQGRSFEKEYETLVTEGEVEVTVDFSMTYYEKMDEANLWGLLVNAGIVTITKEIEEDYYRLRVPNLEVWKVFKELTACHLKIDERHMEKMLNALKRKDMERFAEEYQGVLLELPSYHDLKDENSYHMMTLGMCAFLRKDYDIKSNRETGEGRSDICLYAKHDRYPNLILEFKYTKDEKDDLEKLAEKALEQIKEKQYDAEMTGEVCYVGLAHCGKRVTVHSRVNHSAD